MNALKKLPFLKSVGMIIKIRKITLPDIWLISIKFKNTLS